MNMIRRSFSPAIGRSNSNRTLLDDLFNEPFFAITPFRAMSDNVNELATLPVDVSETEKDVIVRASLPGFKKEGVSIEVQDGVLTISAELDEETEEHSAENAKEKFHRRERRMMSVNRSVALPVAVNDEKAVAELKDGILTLTMPKHEKIIPKKINVK